MQKLLKDNIVLVLGISLPLLLVVFFALASALPKFFVAEPIYDFLFSDGNYGQGEFRVVENKLYYYLPEHYVRTNNEHLYRYIAATGKVVEIAFKFPKSSEQKTNRNNINTQIVIAVDPNKLPTDKDAEGTSKIVSEISKSGEETASAMIPVAELANVKIDAAPIAPDGYKFAEEYNYRHGGDLFLFSPSYEYENHPPVLTKNGKNIPIIYNNSGNGNYYSVRFIGWVIP